MFKLACASIDLVYDNNMNEFIDPGVKKRNDTNNFSESGSNYYLRGWQSLNESFAQVCQNCETSPFLRTPSKMTRLPFHKQQVWVSWGLNTYYIYIYILQVCLLACLQRKTTLYEICPAQNLPILMKNTGWYLQCCSISKGWCGLR